MRFYVFSGNLEWLKGVEREFGSDIKTSSNYGELLTVKDMDETIIITLHDETHPMDSNGHELPFFFNEFRHTPAGTFYSDRFLFGSTFAQNFKELHEAMKEYKKVICILQSIRSGTYHIKYEGWTFTAGHAEDGQNFSLVDENGVVCELLIALDENDRTLEIRFDDGTWFFNGGWYVRENTWLHAFASDIVIDALKRDDPEICSILEKKDGKLEFPYEYRDISREEILENAAAKAESYNSIYGESNALLNSEMRYDFNREDVPWGF